MRLVGSSRISLMLLWFTLLLVVGPLSSYSVLAAPITLVDNDTYGYYNDSLGVVLDRTNIYYGTYLFPGADISDGDPVINNAPEPNLTAADSILGQWLDTPPVLNANWSGPQLIPGTWTINDETAIIYELDAGVSGLEDVVANIGVDNGVFVWLDGTYQFGALAPGYAIEWEYVVPLGDLAPGTHYLQILREDHGGLTGFSIMVTGVPEPTTLLLLGLGGLAVLRKRRS